MKWCHLVSEVGVILVEPPETRVAQSPEPSDGGMHPAPFVLLVDYGRPRKGNHGYLCCQ